MESLAYVYPLGNYLFWLLASNRSEFLNAWLRIEIKCLMIGSSSLGVDFR